MKLTVSEDAIAEVARLGGRAALDFIPPIG